MTGLGRERAREVPRRGGHVVAAAARLALGSRVVAQLLQGPMGMARKAPFNLAAADVDKPRELLVLCYRRLALGRVVPVLQPMKKASMASEVDAAKPGELTALCYRRPASGVVYVVLLVPMMQGEREHHDRAVLPILT